MVYTGTRSLQNKNQLTISIQLKSSTPSLHVGIESSSLLEGSFVQGMYKWKEQEDRINSWI